VVVNGIIKKQQDFCNGSASIAQLGSKVKQQVRLKVKQQVKTTVVLFCKQHSQKNFQAYLQSLM